MKNYKNFILGFGICATFFTCSNNKSSNEPSIGDFDSIPPNSAPIVINADTVRQVMHDSIVKAQQKQDLSNDAFRKIKVERLSTTQFKISGEARVFEAQFGWVIEDGMNELQTGIAKADLGAPAWGKFSFTVDAKKDSENSTVHIILFEESAKDGSRVKELPIYLY